MTYFWQAAFDEYIIKLLKLCAQDSPQHPCTSREALKPVSLLASKLCTFTQWMSVLPQMGTGTAISARALIHQADYVAV